MLPWQGENEEHAIRILIQGNFKLFQHPLQFHDKTTGPCAVRICKSAEGPVSLI